MFCRECGKKLLQDSKFCDNCGLKVENADESKLTYTPLAYTKSTKPTLTSKPTPTPKPKSAKQFIGPTGWAIWVENFVFGFVPTLFLVAYWIRNETMIVNTALFTGVFVGFGAAILIAIIREVGKIGYVAKIQCQSR